MLALALGRTVGELQASMSRNEFIEWTEFYRRWPFDDMHRYHRPAALIAQKAAGGGDIEPLLDFLQPPEVGSDIEDDVDLSIIRALGVSRHRG